MNLIQEVKKVSTRGIVVRTALALAIGGITLASHANAADMELAGAAWVAESEGVLKVSATTRELMLEIPDPVNVTAVTVDQDRRVVWAYAAPNVYAFDFQGQLLFTAPVAGSGTVARMAVVPADGSLWISLDATLFNYGASGQFLRSVAAPGSVKEIAVYESVLASILWVATGDRVVSYDAISGAPLAALDDLGNKPKVQDIGVFGSDLWVALSGSVRYYSSRSDGTAFFRASHSVSGLGGVDAAASKTAWLMTGSDILQAIYTDYPSVQMSLTYHDSLFSGSEKPLAIAAGGPDDSVWAASNTSRLLYYRPGTTPQYLSISPPVVLNALASFPRETGKPGLGFPGLPSGGWFNAEYPTITVSYIDSGSGVDTSTLRVWFYGTSEDLDCSIGESNATCGFASLKPEADYTISATVKDFAGNLASNQTGVRIDRTPPSIAVVSPAEGAELEDPSTPIVVSFDDTRSGVLTSSLVVSLEGPTTEISCSATATSATCTAPGGLSDGTYKVTATVHDRAGNSSQATSTFTFGTPVDVTPPVLSWIAPAEGAAVVDATPVMRFAVDEQGSGVDPATIRITTGGEDLAVECRLRPTEGGCTPLAPLPLGPIEVTLTASDFAGNAADQVSRRFTVISPEVALAGRVLLPDGTPAGGATVSVLGTTALSTSAGADGRFVVAGVRAAVGNVVALTTHVGQGEALLIGGHGGIALRSGGTTDVGDIQLEAPCEPTFLPGMFDGEAALSSSSLVQAVAVFDDGNGAALYLGGTFTSIGGQPLSRIARWDGVSLTPLLGGVNDSVEAMAVFDDGRGPALYVAGFFDAAGGSPVGYVARWDGTVWEALGAGLSWGVRDLEVFDDGRGPALYAGGAFSSAGGETVKGVARWDGFSWTGLGGGVDSPVWALETLTRGEEAWLVAGGDFDTAGGAPASRVALWDGASWTALPGPMSGAVRDLLAVDGDTGSGELYVAGTISRIDGLDFERIARWDGTSWATLGRGLESTVYDLAAFDSGEGLRVVASGQFAGGVRQWDGQRWRGVEGGVDSVSRGMSPFGHLVGRQPDLYVTGPFTRAGGHLAVGLARWARECSPPDRTPPSLRIATPVSGTVTTAATIDLAGSVSEPAAVTVAGQPVAVDAGLSFSVSSLPLVEGTNSILVEATDDTGNASRAVVQVARDSSPPTLLFVSPVAGQVIDSSRPTIRVTYGDAVGVDLDSLQLTAAGAPLAADCNAGFSDAACRLSELLPSGQLTVEASIRDFAGNAGHAQVAFTVDPSADLQDATVLGVVELAGGAPAGGATVRVLGQVGIGAVAAADGSFELAGAAVLAGEPLTVTAQLEDLLGYARIDSPTAGGQHDVGRITLRPACDLQLDPLFRTGLGVDGDYPIKYPSNYDTHYQAGIRAMAVFDDGHGAALYVGGTFLQAGGIRANFVARYDGAGWSPVGSAVYGGGVNGFVQAMTVFDDGSGPALYVGGFFSRADGAPASKIAKWDGTSWQALPVGVGGGVYAFEVWDDGSGPALYVGGNFAMPGGQPGRNVAKWDGTSWYPLDLGLGDSYDTVYALKAFGGGGKGGGKSLLYGGGDFIYTGSTTLRRLAAWNGKSWAEVGGGVGTGTSSERVSSLQVFEGALVLGGHFTSVGGDSSIRGIARWDGRKWSSMGTLGYTTYNLSYEPLGVQALHVHDDGSGPTLFAAGSLSGGSVAKWTGSGWSYADSVPVGGLGWGGEGLASYDPDPTDDQPARLFAGSGARRSQDGRLLNGIASWDGDRWYPIGEGLADQLEDAAVAPGPSGPELLTVDEYSTMWRIRPALGAGLGFSFAQLPSPDLIEHLATVEESGDEVVLALGRSEQAGAWKARGVAAWRGGRWWPLGEGLPFAGGARAAARLGDGPGSPLIMGGTFKHSTWPSPYMAQWDGASWYPVGTGTDGWVDVLISYHDAQGPAVIAAGWFDVAGGERTGPVARWDGRRWSALGEGLEGSADALAAFDDGSGMALYVAGWIAPAGQDPLEGVLRWDGTVWTRLGGEFSAGILDLMVFDDGAGPRLYAAGGFEQIGGKTVKRLARWNGTSWEAAGTDLGSGWVRALAEYDHGEGPALYLAGGFARGAYGKRTNYGYLADAGEIEYLVRLTRPMECSGPDSTPPTLQFTEPAPGASVEANPPDFALAYADEGSGVDTASLQVTVNGAPTLATCTFGASSATCGFDSALPEGVVDLTASIRDAAGNLSATAFLSFRISSGEASIAILAPAQDELVLDAAAQVQLAYSSSAIPETLLLEATPAVGFTCELLETSATCDPTGGFPEGPITLTATIENGAGEVSAPAVVSFTVDTEPPLLAFTAPLEGSTVYSALPELRLAMGDAGAGIDAASLELTEASAPFGASCAFDATGATCLPSAPLAEGQHTLTATVSDLSGKAAAPASITFTVDTSDATAPTISLLAAPALTNQADVVLSGSIDEPASLTVDDTSVPVAADLTFSFGPASLVEGANTFTFVATDLTGNIGGLEHLVVRDSVAPSLAFTRPSPGSLCDTSNQLLELSWSDGGSGVDTASLLVQANGQVVALSCESTSDGASCIAASLPSGDVTLTATVRDRATNLSPMASVACVSDPALAPPMITVYAPQQGSVVATPEITISGALSKPATLLIDGQSVSVGADNTFQAGPYTLSQGLNTFSLDAADGSGGTGHLSLSVTLDTSVPAAVRLEQVTLVELEPGVQSLTAMAGAVDGAGDGNTVVVRNLATGNRRDVVPDGDGSFALTVTAFDGDTLRLTTRNPAGSESAPGDLVVSGVLPQPPDPASVAPPLDPTRSLDTCGLVSFFWTGSPRIQFGVWPEAVDCGRLAVVRGRVLDRSGAPLAGVRVEALGQPDYGATFTRDDGRYDLAGRSGEQVVVAFSRQGYFSVRRTVPLAPRQHDVLGDVVLTAPDAQVTVVDVSGGASGVQVARGSVVTDMAGTRQATLLVPAGTTAALRPPGGAA
ncbi:MAG TPA: Ig-like domain-containing protein, partial [Thermoanaerobaculia bacterium]|nr:Ig-like domain-containing protein [Thermoanaerobaculia bacterium]